VCADTDRSDEVLTRLTREHYEAYPFVEGGATRIDHWERRLREFIPGQSLEGQTILDVGCGSGEVARALANRGAAMVCIDLTRAATQRSRDLVGPSCCQANALHLPFPDASFDQVVSIGVLHHTPDCRAALAEVARVTREGGRIVVLLYSRWTPYHGIYWLTRPIRDRVPVKWLEYIPHWALHPMRLVAGAQVGQLLSDWQLRRLIADQIWTPRASFHSGREVRLWAQALGLQLAGRRRLFLHGNLFEFTPIRAAEYEMDGRPLGPR